MSAALHTVHLRVNDAATGQPTPVRLRVTDGAGPYYAPLGRRTKFALGANEDVGGNVLVAGLPHAYIDGDCEIRLPAGPLFIEISKGPEYQTLRREIVLGPGQMALRFVIERWLNLREERWFSGDTRALFMPPHAALLEAAAEDLAVVNLLACSARISSLSPQAAISNILAFSGQRSALERPGHMVVVNTLNSHPVLGSLALLNCHRPVYPLSFGGDDGLDNWSLADWCDQCHRKNGLVVGINAWRKETGLAAGEILADLVLGKIDALELRPDSMPYDPLSDWYSLLNCGVRVPLVGASGKESNRTFLGGLRTYARLRSGEEFTYCSWIEAVRAGRTFVTNGPLLSFTVNGEDPGAELALPPSAATVHVRAQARSALSFQELELVVNGTVSTRASASGSPTMAELEIDIPSESGWLAVRCQGPRSPGEQIFAHSAPIHLRVKGRPRQPEPAAIEKLQGYLDSALAWVHREGRFENEHQREDLVRIFEAARAELDRRKLGGKL